MPQKPKFHVMLHYNEGEDLTGRISRAAERAGVTHIIGGQPRPNMTAWIRQLIMRALEESERSVALEESEREGGEESE